MTASADPIAMPRIVVYSCVAGRYDQALQPAPALGAVDFVCFTESRSLDAPGWQIRPFASPERLTSGHDINRFHKLFAHHLFPDHRWSIYLDGNIRFWGEWSELVAAMERNDAVLGAFTHPAARTLAQEVEACARLGKFDARDLERARRQLAYYEAGGLGLDTPVSANYLLVRDHRSHGLREAMSLWWSQLFEFSARDQISLQYVLFRHGIEWLALDREGGVDASLLERVPHRRPFRARVLQRLRRLVGSAGR